MANEPRSYYRLKAVIEKVTPGASGSIKDDRTVFDSIGDFTIRDEDLAALVVTAAKHLALVNDA